MHHALSRSIDHPGVIRLGSVLGLLTLCACGTTRQLPLPDSPAAVSQVISSPGAVVDIEIRTRRFATLADTAFAFHRGAFSRLELPEQYRQAAVFSRMDADQPFDAFYRSTTVRWEDILGVRVTERNRVSGLVVGAAIGAGAGALIGGFLVGAASDHCIHILGSCISSSRSRGEAFRTGAVAGGVFGGLAGAITGLVRGGRRTTVWQRQE